MVKRKENRSENPAANASLFSARVSQSWMNEIFKKGSKQPLEESDIHEVLERDSTHHVTTQLKRNWEHEVATSNNPRLLVPMIKLAGFRYFSSVILIIIEMAASITQSIYIGKIVASFQDIETEKREGYVAAIILVLCAFIEVILRHSVFLESLRTGMNARVALSSLVYNKALRMSQSSMSTTHTGQIVNLVTNDVKKTEDAITYSAFLFPAPLLLFITCYLCWREIGFSFLPGMALLLILPVFQSWLGRFFATLRAKTALLRDQRIKLMNEIICGMRVIKMYTWENSFAKIVGKIRRQECEKVLKTSRLNSLNASFHMATIPLVSSAIFIPYVVTGNILTSEKVFTVVAIISSVHVVTSKFVPRSITFLKESGVSLKRIKNFLLLDEGSTLSFSKVHGEQAIVIVENLDVTWNKDSEEELLSNVSFTVSMGELLMITGPVGCGKSSLLMALLGELPVTSGSIRTSGRMAYVSQQPWAFSGTLKENILFGKKFDKKKYEEVIRVCALEKDIKSLLHEDETLVGERGVSLSGGQKARVNLARAIYLDADIYIMDDPLSAVDSHVARHIFDECIRGVLKSKVCILVSHQLHFSDQADRILCLQKGSVVGYGNLQSFKQNGIDVLSMIHTQKANGERSFNRESMKSLQSVTGNDKSPPYSSNLLSTRKRKNNTTTISLHDVSDMDPLLQPNETNVNTNRSKSTPDLRKCSLADDKGQPFKTASSVDDGDQTDKENRPNEKSIEDSAEKRMTGSITFKVYKDYFFAGARPVFLLLCIIIFLTGQISLMISEWWLAKWSNWEESTVNKNNSQSIIEEQRNKNIMIYVTTVVLCFLFAFFRAVIWFQILVNASRHLHDKMFKAVLRTSMYFFDTNSVGRILNRFSKDIGLMDDSLPMAFFDAFQLSVLGLAILVMSVVSQPYVVIVVVPIIAIFIWLRQYFVKSSREVKRLQALSRSPLYSHISATLQGLATIRASEEQNQFIEMYNAYQDHNTSASFYSLCANRWLGYRLDVICASLMSFVAFAPFVAYEAGLILNPVLVGLSLLYTKRLTGMFQFCVRQTAEVENQMVSVERVQEYTHLNPEADIEILAKKPPITWPKHGEIMGKNVFFCYHTSLPPVLKNISFHINAREKIGIVGRTGAGKSSLISALFRLAEPNGVIKIDGVCINSIGLHDLRGKLSVIPQDPVIFAGSVRSNLDPFSIHEDSDLWEALEQVQLKETVESFPDKMEFNLAESGNNLSAGQRQLLCLARAILKHNKILIIDEATANVDHKTDSFIQKTIRDKFKDCTVLTIAHRLNTIIDADRIMVLDSGKVIEFGEPYELLRCESSTFSGMVAQTGKESSLQLQRMARIAHENRARIGPTT